MEMKFCERFNISPLEYASMPKKKIDIWMQMANIESEVSRVKNKLRKLGKLKK